MASITVNRLWGQAQRLPVHERLMLSRRLRESAREDETARRIRVASEIDRFFGGWREDPRSTEEMMAGIREARTENTFPRF